MAELLNNKYSIEFLLHETYLYPQYVVMDYNRTIVIYD